MALAQYPYIRPGQSSKGISHNEFEILKSSHKFLRDDDDGDKPESWNDQLAAKYYDSLYREFAVCDLKHYKTGNFALRWRTEDEVLSGAGETSCGNTRCKHHAAPEGSGPSLSTLELPFAYEEQGKMKSALVKVVLCSKCVNKLMWKRRKEKESRAKASEGAAQDAGDARQAEKAVEASQAPSSKRKRRNDHTPGDATKKSRRDSKSDPVDGC
ncbi:hypothetical protein ONZ45_g11219 [Pleurotus djamor]|nr:hypothetical protein ONZ45_g11219 [Pleurotus djamor]